MPNSKSKRPISLLVAIGAIILVFSLGLYQIYTSNITSVYRDEHAYDREYDAIVSALDQHEINYHTASDRFYDNQDTNMTDKYRLESSGWFYALCAVYGTVGLLAYVWITKHRRAIHKAWLFLVALLSTTMLVAIVTTSLFIDQDRGLFPWWADSIGIALVGGLIFYIVVLVPVSIAFCSISTLGYRRDAPSFSLKKLKSMSTGYRLYFVITTLGILAIGILSLPYPSFDTAPLFAGGLLYNFLLFAGIEDKTRRK